MAKAVGLIVALYIVAVAHGRLREVFHVQGYVYCDPCRVEFVTRLSQKIAGATVRLECRNLSTKAITYSVEGLTGANGHYSLPVTGDHQDDTCEVSVVRSPRKDCSQPFGKFDKSNIECTDNGGMHATVRYANPIGFMTEAVLPQCSPLLSDMGITAP